MNVTGQRVNRIGDGEKTDTTEEEKNQVAASAEDSEMDQMINFPNEKKRLEEDAGEGKDEK